jgi:triacylglycerol lipase
MTFFVQLPVDSYPAVLSFDFGQDSSFNYAASQSMMWLSQLSYEQDNTIETILARWQLTLVKHLHSPKEGPGSDTATQGFVCRRDGTIILAFAGTDPGMLKTVLTDLNTRPDDSGMHPGFRRALSAVWADLQTAVPAPNQNCLFVTGHSLGAALAVLTAFRLQTEAHITADAIYTFGLPRVGGAPFGVGYEPSLGARTFRLVDGDDPVAAIPPSFLGFRHVGRRLSCPHGGSFDAGSAPANAVDDEPAVAQVEADYAGHMVAELLTDRWPAPAQPGILGWLYELLPGGLADHMQARYLRALGTPV